MNVLIFSGGVGLGAYQAGAYAKLHERTDLHPAWVAGSSIGAINAAILAGNEPAQRVARLQAFWSADGRSNADRDTPLWQWDHAQNWLSAVKTRMAGSPGQFTPRLKMPWQRFQSIYDLAPLASRLKDLIDFSRLNAGSVRMTLATTDMESGELVLFDTANGDQIGIDHLLASCGFLPEFAPLEIGGRLLGDGGLSANAPIEALHLAADQPGDLTCFVLDLFARDGERPHDLESAMSRKNDLMFSNQTWQRLEAYRREREWRRKVDAQTGDARIFYLSYRPRREEAGAERGFDYSSRMIDRRWSAGFADMAEAISQLDEKASISAGVSLRAIRRAYGGLR